MTNNGAIFSGIFPGGKIAERIPGDPCTSAQSCINKVTQNSTGKHIAAGFALKVLRKPVCSEFWWSRCRWKITNSQSEAAAHLSNIQQVPITWLWSLRPTKKLWFWTWFNHVSRFCFGKLQRATENSENIVRMMQQVEVFKRFPYARFSAYFVTVIFTKFENQKSHITDLEYHDAYRAVWIIQNGSIYTRTQATGKDLKKKNRKISKRRYSRGRQKIGFLQSDLLLLP